MTGLNDTDIRLSEEWQLTQAANGDAPVCSGFECLHQNIALEAVTQKGDLFYDPDFGWDLSDFIQSEDDELTRMELIQRARLGLQARETVLSETISISVEHDKDTFRLACSFRFDGDTETRKLNIVIDSVTVEVETDAA